MQGEDVVAGIRTPEDIDTMRQALPDAYKELLENCDILEGHYKEMMVRSLVMCLYCCPCGCEPNFKNIKPNHELTCLKIKSDGCSIKELGCIFVRCCSLSLARLQAEVVRLDVNVEFVNL